MELENIQRYKCQLNLPEIGLKGQQKLSKTKILCVGAGGLANSALPYIAAAGVGSITVVDGDTISLGNLHRQVLYNQNDVGKNKANIICSRLQVQNPNITCVAVPEYLDLNNAANLIENHDIVLDCSDNYYTRYLINDFCYLNNKPDIFAGVIGFEGYISIFSINEAPCYRCLYAQPPKIENVTNCSDEGVLGTVPGIFGLMQATEAIKFALEINSSLIGYLVKINFHNMEFTKRKILHVDDCCLCGLKQPFANLQRFEEYETHKIKKLSVAEFYNDPKKYLCVDVREPYEYNTYNLGFINFPFSQFGNAVNDIKKMDLTKPILVCCAHGVRSKIAAKMLKDSGCNNVLHLEGGIEQYRELYDHA